MLIVLDGLDEIAHQDTRARATLAAHRFGQAGWPSIQGLNHRMLDRPSTAVLDGIRTDGIKAVCNICGDISGQLPAAFLEAIMNGAGAYPFGLLLAAE